MDLSGGGAGAGAVQESKDGKLNDDAFSNKKVQGGSHAYPDLGRDLTSEDSKGTNSTMAFKHDNSSKDKDKELMSTFPPAADEDVPPLVFEGFAELPEKAALSHELMKDAISYLADEEQVPLYPNVFEGFAELPEKAAVSHELMKDAISYPADEEQVPLYPNVFDRFSELPDDSLLKSALSPEGKTSMPGDKSGGCEDAETELGSPKLTSFEGFSELPVNVKELNEKGNNWFDNCEGMLNDNKENRSNADSLKRNFCNDDEIELGSPKRMKSEDGTIWAQSPNETYRIAAIIRSMLRMRNNREVQHLRRREKFQLGKREDMVGHREVEVAGREIRVRDREIRADKKEETLDQIKSELKKDEASDVAADLNKNSGTVIPADPAVKESAVALNMEKAKKVIEAVDANAMLGDKFLNIPKKGKELVKSYQENKEILKNMYADNKK